MRVAWEFSGIDRVRVCRKHSVRPLGTVDVRRTVTDDGVTVGFSGLATCGSVWACPLCSVRIQAERREELRKMLKEAARQGYTIAFGTVTLRHKKGQPLRQLWDVLGKAFTGVSQARSVRKIRDELGRYGYIRAVEVTYGDNGWHPHIHTLQLFRKQGKEDEILQEDLDRLADAEFAIWERQATKRGLGAPLRDNYRLDLVHSPEEIADYITKSDFDPWDQEFDEARLEKKSKSMKYEMAGVALKQAKLGSRTPFQILIDVAKNGDADDLDLWHEYEEASRGRRSLVWSQGLKDEFLIEDRTDEEIAAEEAGSEADGIFAIADWSPIADDPALAGALLDAVQEGGVAGGIAFCDAVGLVALAMDDPLVVEDKRLMEEAWKQRFQDDDS